MVDKLESMEREYEMLHKEIETNTADLLKFANIYFPLAITILGFSYSDIDTPYLEKIVEMTGDDVYVHFGHHTFMEFNRALRVAGELGVSARFMDF